MKLNLRSSYQLSSTAQDQSGVVSTYVSMGVIGILSLISISFAFLMQTEYTQARDRQFNTQARIAAETAINDARQIVYKAIGNRLNLSQFIALKDSGPPYNVIDSSEATVAEISFYDANDDGLVDFHDDILQRPYDTLLIEEWYDCGGGSGVNRADQFEGDLDGSGSIEYTCVEVDGRPVKLVYDTINPDRSENILIQTRGFTRNTGKFFKSNVDELVINWQQAVGVDKSFQPASTHGQKLPPQGDWLPSAPILKVQIIPLNIREGWTREELNKSTRNYFLYPTEYDATANTFDAEAEINLYNPNSPITANNKIINADCDLPADVGDKHCAVRITGFGSNGNSVDPAGTCTHPPHKTQVDCEEGPDGILSTADDGTWTGSSYTTNNAKGDIGNLTDGTCTEPAHTTELDCTSGTPPGTWTEPNADEMVYIVLVRSIYGDASLAISANSNLSCNPQPECRTLRFVNQQINITSTGRAGGLTYRIREVIPIRPKYNRPENAVDSAEHICKILIGEPDTGISYDYSVGGGGFGLDPAEEAFCQELHPS